MPRHHLLAAPLAPEFCKYPRQEGAGNAGCFVHPQPCVRKAKAHKRIHHRFTEQIRHSLRDGLRLIPRSSRRSGSLSPSLAGHLQKHPLAKSILANLTSASRRQNHVASSYASMHSSVAPKRPPHPASTFVTIAKRPLESKAGQRESIELLLARREAKYFRKRTGHQSKSGNSTLGQAGQFEHHFQSVYS